MISINIKLPGSGFLGHFALLFLLSILLLTALPVLSQTNSIKFVSSSWEEIKSRAARENKLIFMDAYASWCGPCKKMEKEVFTLDTVADYFNSNFINFKIDVDSDQGNVLASYYNINLIPTYLFLDSLGNVIQRSEGVQNPDQFLNIASVAQIRKKLGQIENTPGIPDEIEEEKKRHNKIEIGFNISQYQRDFGFGIHLLSPYFFMKSVAVRAGANVQWLEHSDGKETKLSIYQNFQLGMRGRTIIVSDNISVYGEGGILLLVPNRIFSSESFLFGGYGKFGFEFRIVPRFAYFIEFGAVGTGATADKVAGKPIYSNGFLSNVGFKFGF